MREMDKPVSHYCSIEFAVITAVLEVKSPAMSCGGKHEAISTEDRDRSGGTAVA
jgi:hypothetical protein